MPQQRPHDASLTDLSRPELSRATEIRHAESVIGVLITENVAIGNRELYRFKALDRRFQLLDGSRFFAVQNAATAVDRISRLAARPIAANQH